MEIKYYWIKETGGKIKEFASSDEELYRKMEERDLAFCEECDLVVEPVGAYRPWDLDQCPFCGREIE